MMKARRPRKDDILDRLMEQRDSEYLEIVSGVHREEY